MVKVEEEVKTVNNVIHYKDLIQKILNEIAAFNVDDEDVPFEVVWKLDKLMQWAYHEASITASKEV